MWIKDKDCRAIIQQCWCTDRDINIMEKMGRCCAKLEEWGGGMVMEMKYQMAYCRRELKKYRSRRDTDGILHYNRVRWEYFCLLEKQEIYWKQ